jgi:hypothetical protein
LYAGLIVSTGVMLVVTFLNPPPTEEQLHFIRPMQVSKQVLEEEEAASSVTTG